MEDASRSKAAAMAWWHATQATICDRIERSPHGTVVRATEFPTYHDYNLLRVEDHAAAAAELAAEADRGLATLEHRKVQVDDELTGERLRPGFDALGWRTERLAWMVHDGPPPAVRPPAGAEITDAERPAIRDLRVEWTEHRTPEQIAEFLPVEDVVAERLGAQLLAAQRDADLVGFVQWRRDGPSAEVMLVYVTPAARDGGIGGALVAESAGRAFALGAERVFVVADDERDAKRLYERLGFRTVWIMHDFVLELERP